MAYFLSPIGNAQMLSNAGIPLSGGKIYTYFAGTSTAAATFTDSTSGTQQANPIILNTLGLPASPIWLLGGFPLKFAIYDSSNVLQRTVDNISGVNDISASASEWVDSGLTPTYISATQFSVMGDQTGTFLVNRRVKTKNTSGFVYGRITASSYSSVTTVTVLNDSGVLDSGLSTVAYSFISGTPSSVPYNLYAGAGSNSDITALTALATVPASISNTWTNGVRQTVLSGAVDTNGFAAFGGSTGSTTVTASSVLVVTAANGVSNRTGSTTNPSWTSLSTNGTMYLGLTVNADGTCTPFSTILAPTYQWGGTFSVTNNQRTFNIQAMQMQVGNGSTAAQSYDVFVGEVTVAGAVVTAITWYALMGRYVSQNYGLALSTLYSNNHNIGVVPRLQRTVLVNTTTDLGYAVGDEVDGFGTHISNNTAVGFSPMLRYKTILVNTSVSGGSGIVIVKNDGTFGVSAITLASWKLKSYVDRGW